MLRCTPQSKGTSSLMIERYTSMESVRDTVSPIIYPFKSLSKLISNTQIPSPPSTPDTHTSRPSATSPLSPPRPSQTPLIYLSTSFACPAPSHLSKQTQPKTLTLVSQTHSPPHFFINCASLALTGFGFNAFPPCRPG